MTVFGPVVRIPCYFAMLLNLATMFLITLAEVAIVSKFRGASAPP